MRYLKDGIDQLKREYEDCFFSDFDEYFASPESFNRAFKERYDKIQDLNGLVKRDMDWLVKLSDGKVNPQDDGFRRLLCLTQENLTDTATALAELAAFCRREERMCRGGMVRTPPKCPVCDMQLELIRDGNKMYAYCKNCDYNTPKFLKLSELKEALRTETAIKFYMRCLKGEKIDPKYQTAR